MARQTTERDLTPILAAAKEWIDHCLVGDGSVLSEQHLWAANVIQDVREAFVEHPDAREGHFFPKLKEQMAPAAAVAKQLMAEMLWALLLFPSNVRPKTKRHQVVTAWSWSGEDLSGSTPFLSDGVLIGIGSGGPGFNNHRWRQRTATAANRSQSSKRQGFRRLRVHERRFGRTVTVNRPSHASHA